MAIPVTFAVRPAEGGVQVTIQFGVETEPGQTLDREGRTVKPHFIEEVIVRHNQRTVLTAYLGPVMARKPILSFGLDKARAGDVVSVMGGDNRGESFEAVHRLV